MKYAIIAVDGRQLKVEEGQEVILDYQSKLKPEDKHTFSDVFLFVDGEIIKIGNPKVENIEVLATVIKHSKGEKIRVAKFKAKAKYRRVTGFRSKLTNFKIDKISIKAVKKEAKKSS